MRTLLSMAVTRAALAAGLCLAAAPGCGGGGGGAGADGGAGAAGPVTFSNLRVEDVTAYRAVVRFDTSRETSCHVEFGTSPGALDATATDPTMKPGTYRTDHNVPLEDLQPATHYTFVAVATTPQGETFTSDPAELTTLEGMPVDSMTDVAGLAAGAQVMAVSSNFGGAGNDSTWGADNALDGQMATEWSSQGDGDGAFLEVDLGQARAVQVIGFRSRKMTDGTSIIRSFQLVIDGGATTLGPFSTPDPDARYLFPLDPPVSMTDVRMEAIETSGGNTGLKELELFVP